MGRHFNALPLYIVLFWFRGISITLSFRRSWMSMKLKPITYKTITIPSDIEKEMTLLVKDDASHIFQTIESNKGIEFDQNTIDQWIEEGSAVPFTPQGTRDIHNRERKMHRNLQRSSTKQMIAADVFVNKGTEEKPIYVKRGSFSTDDLIEAELNEMIKSGDAFTNVTKLLEAEKILNRADNIALRLKTDFAPESEEWARWTKMSDAYNVTSLEQVMAEYFRSHSIGDVGGKNADYVPKPGFVGTLAPGQNFKEDYSLDSLPKRILHPWPAMQEFQFHVRWPPSHPMIPPPLLWIGLNDKYTSNFTRWQLEVPRDEILGGIRMEAKDAIHIAKYGQFGDSYDPKIQLKHGGMVFDAGYKIPFYNPDHGPTVPDEEVENKIPEKLIPITTTWLDPFYGLDLEAFPATDSVEQISAEEKEEEARRVAAEKLMESWETPSWMEQEKKENENIEAEITARVEIIKAENRKELKKLPTEYDDENNELISDEDIPIDAPNIYLDLKQWQLDEFTVDESEVEKLTESEENMRNKLRKSIDQIRTVSEVSSGRARGRRQLLTYAIESMREMSEEIDQASKDPSISIKRSGRRRQRKPTVDVDEEITVENESSVDSSLVEVDPGFDDSAASGGF